MNNKKAILEVLKSAGRYVWFGLLGVIIVALTAIAGAPEIVSASVQVGDLEISIGFILVAVIGSIIKGIDLYIHKNKNIDSNGLAPSFLQK